MKRKDVAYNFSADVLRALAILGVVTIHTVNAVFGRPDFFGGISWWVAIILNSLSRVSVPLFIMLSGYFILQKDESYAAAWKRTFQKLIVPFLFWLLVYILWNGGDISFYALNLGIMQRLFTVNVLDLYFFVILIGLYLVSPLLRSYLEKGSVPQRKIFMFTLLILGCGMFFFHYLFSTCSPGDIFTYWVPYTGLFIAGYVLGTNKSNLKTVQIGALYFLSLGVTIGGSYLYFLLTNHGNHILNAHGCLSYYTDSYLSITVVMMTICTFILGMRSYFDFIRNKKVQSIIHGIARSSLGIYVLHIFVLDILDGKLHLFDQIHPVWLYIVIKVTVIFFLSTSIAVVCIRIPGIRFLLGERKSQS